MMSVYGLFCFLSYIQQEYKGAVGLLLFHPPHMQTHLLRYRLPSPWLPLFLLSDSGVGGTLITDDYTLYGVPKVVKKCALVKGPPFHLALILTLSLQLIIINELGVLEFQRLNLSVERDLLPGTGAPLVPR